MIEPRSVPDLLKAEVPGEVIRVLNRHINLMG